MKNIFSKFIIASAVVGAGMISSSCNSELDQYPNNYYVPETFWQNAEQFTQFITAQQNMFRANYPTNILYNAGDVRAGGFFLGNLPDGSGTNNETYIQNQYTAANCQFSNFGGYFGFIANLNELLYRIDNQDGLLDDNTANGLRAIAYGWRAFCFFQMYRMYGGVPLRLEPDVVVFGITDPVELYMPRATAEQTLAQIKSDIDASLNCFNNSTFTITGATGGNYVWTKAATELLAGQVYLWSGKVSTGDHNANPSDVATAKGYFQNVLNNYGFQLDKDYFNIWQTPQNKENIFAVCYSSLEDGTFYTMQTNFNWSRVTGTAGNTFWSTWDDDGYEQLTDGTANRFGRWATKDADGKVTQRNSKVWDHFSLGVQRTMYKNAFFFQFNENDQRGKAFYPVYKVTDLQQATNVLLLDDFDPHDYTLAGTFIIKFRYKALEGYQYWQPCVDMPIYRLPDAILGLAECANYEDDNNGVKTYINMLRERAYGDNWDESSYGYTPGDFKTNEVAILQESDKEFFLEGRRWFDLRRLTAVKGGAQTDHLVFQPEGCIGWGLPTATSPWMVEADGAPVTTAEPILPTSWEYRLLWPINAALMSSDPEIEQNPGYSAGE